MGANYGVVNSGSGSFHTEGNAFGPGATVHHRHPVEPGPVPSVARADVGVITVLSEETSAVVEVLRRAAGYREVRASDGSTFYQAEKNGIRIVVSQTTDRGQLSAVAGYHRLWAYCAPRVVALVGIAGGIHCDLSLGDVVIGDEIVYYESRREAAGSVQRRGTSQRVTSAVLRMLNGFFQATGEPCRLISTGPDQTVGFRVFRGPIGSGEAVLADGDSGIRDYLRAYNDRILAVETEAAGVARAFHERPETGPEIRGWLTIRGISDHADAAKDDSYHEIAARHAAQVLEVLLPFLG